MATIQFKVSCKLKGFCAATQRFLRVCSRCGVFCPLSSFFSSFTFLQEIIAKSPYLILKLCLLFRRRFLNSIRTIMSGPLFFTLSSCIVYIAIEFLALDETFRRQDFDTTLLVTVNALLITIAMVYILSFYSEKLTTHSYEIAHMVYVDLLWYKLTAAQQKPLVLSICRANKYFRLVGYGIFYCSMETFLKVRWFFFQVYRTCALGLTCCIKLDRFDE